MVGTVIPLNVRKANGSFAITAPKYVNAVSLSANTAKIMTQPLRGDYVFFSAAAPFYVNFYATATVPGDVSDGTASDLSPTQVWIPSDIIAISIISPTAQIVTGKFYSE